MKQIKEIKNRIKWERFYDPDFKWYAAWDYEPYFNDIKFLDEFRTKIDWSYLCYVGFKLNDDTIRYFSKYTNCLDWGLLCEHKKLTVDFIHEFQDYLDWNIVCKFQNLSEELIDEFNYLFNCDIWKTISKYQKLSDTTIIKYADKLNWKDLSKFQSLGGDIIDIYFYHLDLTQLCQNQRIPEWVLRKHANDFSERQWYWISHDQTLSEEFIEEFKDKLDWHMLSVSRKSI